MSVHASSTADRLLDLNDLLRELVSQGHLSQSSAEQCLAIRRSAVNNQQHPLEFIASQQLDDLRYPGKKLELENLTVWLAALANQPYMRIDPLKIDVAAVTPLMSYAFAQRHKILAVAVMEKLNSPETVGVPLKAPPVVSVMPAGRVPLLTA